MTGKKKRKKRNEDEVRRERKALRSRRESLCTYQLDFHSGLLCWERRVRAYFGGFVVNHVGTGLAGCVLSGRVSQEGSPIRPEEKRFLKNKKAKTIRSR